MLKCENESDGSVESMNGSWVKLDPARNGNSHNNSPKLSDGEEMETLLADAVEEQMKLSRSQHNEKESIFVEGKTDWVQAWASRPEQRPSKKIKMEHPPQLKTSALSIRRTKVMKSGAELLTANLMVVVPILVISHAVTLGIGIYLGKKFSISMSTK